MTRRGSAASGATGPRDAKECAVSADRFTRNDGEDSKPGRDRDGTSLLEEERPLDVWSRCAPIRLAGYEDDPSETHILRSID
jgi:hypothetical protein